jgi:hypothetical protein
MADSKLEIGKRYFLDNVKDVSGICVKNIGRIVFNDLKSHGSTYGETGGYCPDEKGEVGFDNDTRGYYLVESED